MKTRTREAEYRRILSMQPHVLTRLDAVAKIMTCNRGQEISASGGPAGQWYYVLSGAVRRCAVRPDGRRQIVDLVLPREFVFVSDNRDEGTIEAIVDNTVLVRYPGGRVEEMAERDPQFARDLREVVFQSLARSRDQLLILGSVTALEKLASFLLSLERRASTTTGQVDLPFSRYDMADYLAISVETVCRAITDLQRRGVIALAGKRTIKILNRSALTNRVGGGQSTVQRRLLRQKPPGSATVEGWQDEEQQTKLQSRGANLIAGPRGPGSDILVSARLRSDVSEGCSLLTDGDSSNGEPSFKRPQAEENSSGQQKRGPPLVSAAARLRHMFRDARPLPDAGRHRTQRCWRQ